MKVKNIFSNSFALLCVLMIFMYSCAAQKVNIANTINTAQSGVTPDDGKNDSKQIQSLINNAKPGAILFFPKGIYLIDAPIEISKSGITLKGEAGTIFKFTNDTDWYAYYKTRVGMINICSKDITINNIYLDEGFARSGRKDGQKPLIGGILLGCRYKGPAKRSTNITITNCTVYDYYGDAISVFNAYCENFTVTHNTLISSYIAGKWDTAGTGGEQAINAVAGKNILIDSNTIQGALDDAIAIHTNSENVKITNNIITTTGGRITVGGTINGLIANNTITYIQDGGSAIDLSFEPNDANFHPNNGVAVTGNKIYVPKGIKIVAAIRLMGPGNNITVTNNVFETADTQGIGLMMKDGYYNKTNMPYFGENIIVKNNSFINFKYGVWRAISKKVAEPKGLDYSDNNYKVAKMNKEKGDE